MSERGAADHVRVLRPPAVVEPYDPAWPNTFQRLAERLREGLTVEHVLEHVGSTAVPGLAAKPIIDIDVVLGAQQDVSTAISDLALLGYAHKGALGIVGREAFDPPLGLPYHHLYVVLDGSMPLRDHLDLRDFLRANPLQAHRYGEEKLRLAPLLHVDREAYGAAKHPLVEELTALARNNG